MALAPGDCAEHPGRVPLAGAGSHLGGDHLRRMRELLQKLSMELPAQPPPRITAKQLPTNTEQPSQAAAV